MELEGLDRAMKHLKAKGISPSALVTDGHVQIPGWIKAYHSEIDHFLDVWHVAKGR